MFEPRVGMDWFASQAAPLLLSPATSEWLSRLAARFPCTADCLILERRLAPESVEVDFMFAVTRPTARGTHWRSLLETENSLQSHRQLLNAWGTSAALAASPLVWFEWDKERGEDAAPLCSIAQTDAILEKGEHFTCDEQIALASASARAFGFEGAEFSRRVADCRRRLPGSCQLLHVASLRPRGLDRLRLTVSLPAPDVTAWLEAIDWPGDLDAVKGLLEGIQEPFGRLSIQIELLPEVGAYLAIESRERNSENDFESCGPIFRRLANSTSLSAEVLEACLAWPGRRSAPPPSFQAERIEQTLYFKFALDPNGGVVAKAYLGLMPIA